MGAERRRDPGEVAATDQARAEARDFASVTASYHRGLIDSGLSAEEATSITEAFVQARMIAGEEAA